MASLHQRHFRLFLNELTASCTLAQLYRTFLYTANPPFPSSVFLYLSITVCKTLTGNWPVFIRSMPVEVIAVIVDEFFPSLQCLNPTRFPPSVSCLHCILWWSVSYWQEVVDGWVSWWYSGIVQPAAGARSFRPDHWRRQYVVHRRRSRRPPPPPSPPPPPQSEPPSHDDDDRELTCSDIRQTDTASNRPNSSQHHATSTTHVRRRQDSMMTE